MRVNNLNISRLFDIGLSLLILIPALIIICFLALYILIFNRYLPLILQTRIGIGGKQFTCLKLRTIKKGEKPQDVGDPKKKLEMMSPATVPFRDHGWDELPQILCVLSGRMSFVGPRPHNLRTIERIKERNPDKIKEIEEWEKAREKVLPGISGWHQIHSSGPHELTYDMEYLKNPSFPKKVQVVWVSILILILGRKRYFRWTLAPEYASLMTDPLVNVCDLII